MGASIYQCQFASKIFCKKINNRHFWECFLSTFSTWILSHNFIDVFDREKMNDLKRQKERLEEKIMEHYKRQDNQKK